MLLATKPLVVETISSLAHRGLIDLSLLADASYHMKVSTQIHVYSSWLRVTAHDTKRLFDDQKPKICAPQNCPRFPAHISQNKKKL